VTDDADTVLEVKADAALTAHFALNAGDDPAGVIQQALADCVAIHHVDDLDIGQVYPIKEY
jgi:hypothetical protein